MQTIFKPKEYLPQRILIEIWDYETPGVICGLNLDEKRLLLKDQVKEVLAGWNEIAGRLKRPMITVQANINEGVFVAYEFKDGRKEIPAICNGFTLKHIFDDNVRPLHMSYSSIDEMPGYSIVFHSPFNSKTLEKELVKLVEIINDFFDKKGDISKSHREYFKNINFIGEEFLIDNKKLLTVNIKRLKASLINALREVFENKYVVILEEKVYEKNTPLVYWIAKNNPQGLSERIKRIANERGISYKEAIQQHEYFGQRIGG